MEDIGRTSFASAEEAFQAWCSKRLLPLQNEEREYQKKIDWQEQRLEDPYEVSSHWWLFLLGGLAGIPLFLGLYFVGYLQFVVKTIISVVETGQGSIMGSVHLADYPGVVLVFGMMALSFAIGIFLRKNKVFWEKMEREAPEILEYPLNKLERKSKQQKELIKQREDELNKQKEVFLKRYEKRGAQNQSITPPRLKKINEVLQKTLPYRFIKKTFFASSSLEVYTYGLIFCFIFVSIVINAIGYGSFIQNNGYNTSLNVDLMTNQMWGHTFSAATFNIMFIEPYLSILLTFVCVIFTLGLLRLYTIGSKKQKTGLSIVLAIALIAVGGLAEIIKTAPFLALIGLIALIGVMACCTYPETRCFAKRILKGVLFGFFGVGAIFFIAEYLFVVAVIAFDIALFALLAPLLNKLRGDFDPNGVDLGEPLSTPGKETIKETPSSGKRQIVIGVNGMVFRGETATSGKALFSCNKNNPSAMAANRLCSQAEYDRGEVKIVRETMFSGTEEVTSIASSPPRGAFPLAAKWL